MQALGEDIVLLAVTQNGTVAGEKLHFALAGSELVRLAAAGRIGIDRDGYVRVLDASPTGHANADLALAALAGAARPPRAREWVADQPAALVTRYLDGLAGDDVIRAEGRRVLGLFRTRRWVVVDEARRADAKRRLDAIASSTGPITPEQAAFAGLVYVAGLGRVLYPTQKDAAAHSRLAAIAWQKATVPSSGAGDVDTSVYVASDVASEVATRSLTMAAVQSSVVATHHAVIQHRQTTHDSGSHHGGGSQLVSSFERGALFDHGSGSHHGGGSHHDGGSHHGGGGMGGGHH